MKTYILVFIAVLSMIFSYGQDNKTTGTTKQTTDNFTYKKIEILEREEGTLSLTGASASSGSPLSATSSSAMTSNSASGIGETTGALSVSRTGGAKYDVPIAVPPGINGIAPEISLSYDSQAGNGIAGYGWNISGISTISKVPATAFHDNQIDAVDMDNLDRFALDGQRLILKSGTYGANGAAYETEQYSNIKIVSYGTHPINAAYGPEYFIVNYSDGSIAHYGHSTDSRSFSNYSITYWENPQGIRISYEYTLSNNAQYINKITYGGINGQNDINEIRFNFTANTYRWEQAFMKGNMWFVRDEKLDNIEVLSNNVGYRNYSLDYSSNHTASKYIRLASITESSGDGSTSHSPITFSYNSTSPSVNFSNHFVNLSVGNINQNNAEIVPFDLTGNGKMDFIIYEKATKNKYWIFKENGITPTMQGFKVDSGNFESLFPTTLLNHQNKVLAGQGFTLVQNGSNNEVDFKVYSNGSSGPFYYQYTKTWNAPSYINHTSPGNTETRAKPHHYISGDFNGDGLTDVLAVGLPFTQNVCFRNYFPPDYEDHYADYFANYVHIYAEYDDYYFHIHNGNPAHYNCNSHSSSNSYVHFIDLKRNISTGFANNAGTLQQGFVQGDNLSTGDFNGDGKTDLIHFTNGKLWVYALDDSNNLTLLWETTDALINVYDAMLGDYNGDGKTDFLQPTANNSYNFKWFMSSGESFVRETRTQPFQYKVTNWNGNNGVFYGYSLLPFDANGDGKTDIVEYNTETNNGGNNSTETVRIYDNRGVKSGTNVTTRIKFESAGSTTKSGTLEHFPIPVFLSSNQKNKSLEFASVSDNSVTKYAFTQDHREDVLIRSVTNNGVTHSIEYSDLDASLFNSALMQIYEPANDMVYPYADLKTAPGNKIVSELQRSSTGTTTLKQLYTYYGAVYNAKGLGFQGFSGVAQSNWHTNGSDRIMEVSKFDPLLRGAITFNYSLADPPTFIVPSSGYIKKTTYSYDSSLSTNKVFKLWLTSNLEQNVLDGTYIIKNYVYDTYNNPTKITTSYLFTGSNVVDITYANSTGSPYYIGRPTAKTETTNITGETFSKRTELTYSGYLVSQKLTRGHNTPFDTETFIYDAYGNITKKTATPFGETAREIHYEYDNSGRFLTKETDTEGLETTYQYNVNTGTLSKETTPFNQDTNYTYDVWNRITKVTDYLGNDVTTSYVEASDHSYTVTNTGDDGSGSITIFDALKRVTTAKSKDALGQWVSVSYQYDDLGRLWKESEPYITSASQWNEIEYDLYSRPIIQTAYTGKVTNISYSGLTVTTDDGTQTKSITKNAMGFTTSVTDQGGTINYLYYGNGNLKQSDFNGTIVSTEQDGWGRRTKLTDPSAGVYTYAYNGFGEITNETTPKGSTTYSYSAIGKLNQKVITGDNTDINLIYGYNSTNKLLSSIYQITTDGNNAVYFYTYDSHHRLKKTTEANSYVTFTKEVTYDTFGRIDTEEYYSKLLLNNRSTIKKIKNTYQNGGLIRINHVGGSNESLWTLNELNARGQITEMAHGNGLREFNTYDAYGYLTQSDTKVVLPHLTIEYMTLTNDFNVQRGTLNSRTNSLFSWDETFTYDSLDRLIDFNDNNGDNNHTYDLLGRITSNSDVGDYAYTGSSYQLGSVDLNNQGDIYFQNKSLQQVTYNAFKKPFEINQDGKEKIGFQYNAFMGRSHMFYGDTNSDILQRNNRKHYSFNGRMEISHDFANDKTTFVSYLNGDGYDATVIWRSEQDATTTNEAFHFLHRDYLGSILMITNRFSQVKEKRHFDAWGNLVKLTDGQGNNVNKFVYLDRGYTGHEHLQGVNLIHMNGRLYDPKLKRFLSVDNFIQDVTNTQNFNRYSYVLNNPLMYTDPSGELIEPSSWLAIGIGSAAFSAYNIIKENWGGIDRWTTDNIFKPLQDMQFGRWVKGWFKIRGRSVAPVEYHNYTGLSSDPLAGASATIPPSFFGGSGTSAGGLGIATNQQENQGGIIFVHNLDPSVNYSEFNKTLREHLIKNGFSENTQVAMYSGWKSFKAKWKGIPTASLIIQNFYAAGSPLDGKVAGYALSGSNHGLVYGKGVILGRKRNPSLIDLVNVATHELGHAMFSFEHSETGIMFESIRPSKGGTEDLIDFDSEQQETITTSIWGQ